MRSVLIGADILKLENGYKLLEINTDADLFLPDVPYMDLDPLFTYLVDNEYTKFVMIYKKKHIADGIADLFEARCNELSIEFSTISIPANSVTIPSITDEPNTFYLRCAYDVSAIIDDTYCRDKSEVANLLFESNNEDVLPKTYVKYTGDDSILDNLSELVNNGISPNLIAKKILPDFDRINYPAFYNITSSVQLDTLKSELSDDVMLQEFEINTNLNPAGKISNVIRLNVVLLSDVETIIPIGISITNNQLPLDTSVVTYTNNRLDNKWRAMYFSNPNYLGFGVPGNYEVIKIVDGIEEVVSIETLSIGDTIKSVRFPNLSLSASVQETLDWYISSDSLDTITYETSSVNFITNKEYQGWLVDIAYGDGTISGSTILANSELLVISSSVNNDVRFVSAADVTLNDYIITTNEIALPITSKENVWYSGSIIILDIEPDDVFVAGTMYNDITKNNVGNILLHNKCHYYPYCCFSETTPISMDGIDKQIKDVVVGDLVWSFNFDTNQKELNKVSEIVSPIQDDIVEIKFKNGTSILNTFDHPYYNVDGKLISYSPEKTMEWYKGEILKMDIGSVCIDINGNNVEIESITEIVSPIQTYNLFVENNHNFYANSILVYDEQK